MSDQNDLDKIYTIDMVTTAWAITMFLTHLMIFSNFYKVVKKEMIESGVAPAPNSNERLFYILKRFFPGYFSALLLGVLASTQMPFYLEKQNATVCELDFDIDNLARAIFAVGALPFIGALSNYAYYEGKERANFDWQLLAPAPDVEQARNNREERSAKRMRFS